MLLRLIVRDFVIVDTLDLDFHSGFTVLTGETGAGKSILIDALALALGERGDAAVVRAGCERADISAEFDIQPLPELAHWLRAAELEGDPGLVLLRRIIDRNGRSRANVTFVTWLRSVLTVPVPPSIPVLTALKTPRIMRVPSRR